MDDEENRRFIIIGMICLVALVVIVVLSYM